MSMSSEMAGTIEELEFIGDGKVRDDPSQNSKPITLNQRMLSACVGSLLTSLVVTPFDVVRIRLQQQQILLPSYITSTDGCCKQVFWQVDSDANIEKNTLLNKTANTIPGSAVPKNNASMNEFCISNSCAQDMKIKGTFSGISKIYTHEGFFALYRGLSLVLLMAVPSNVVYFSGYEYLRDSSPIKHYSVINPLLCGALARVLSATSVAPIELLKTRLQSIPTTSKLNSNQLLHLVLKNSFKEIKETGLSSLFRGLQITLWRDVPFSGIYWSSYEFVSRKLKQHFPQLRPLKPSFDSSNNTLIDSRLFLNSFLSGSISGLVAAILTNPFDVGKTRLQVSAENLKIPMFKFLYGMVKNEGISSLYCGLLPRSLKIAPSCAIMISTYELSKRLFAVS